MVTVIDIFTIVPPAVLESIVLTDGIEVPS